MSIIYNLFFFLFLLFSLPYYLIKSKFHKGLFSRLGFFPRQPLTTGYDIWIHAVSVGEVLAIKGLLDILSKEKRVCLSTTTPAGNKIAKDLFKDKCTVIFSPLDFSFVVNNFITKIKPKIFVLVETELWPNLIRALSTRAVPIILVNGRISDKSFGRYKFIKIFLKGLLSKITLFCMRTQTDADRIIYLGASPDRVKVAGNMKFDIVNQVKASIYKRESLGLLTNDILLVAGSTHAGEERIIIDVYKKLILNYTPNLKLLIAPRNPYRFDEVDKVIEEDGFSSVRFSRLADYDLRSINNSIFLLDTMGELSNIYSIADIVFIGGSLIKKGGHNVIEPAIFSKPIIVGPYNNNFRDIVDLFSRNNALIKVMSQLEFKESLSILIKDNKKRESLGLNAKKTVLENIGATQKTYECIKEIFGGRSL